MKRIPENNSVMSRNGHITKRAGWPKGKPTKDEEWFQRKVTELGEAINQLSPDRQERFENDLESIAKTVNDEQITRQ
jgi:hypothetical protein